LLIIQFVFELAFVFQVHPYLGKLRAKLKRREKAREMQTICQYFKTICQKQVLFAGNLPLVDEKKGNNNALE
jgi:hypothetical protein